MALLLYRTAAGPVVSALSRFYSVDAQDWDELLNTPGLLALLSDQVQPKNEIEAPYGILSPMGKQELWGAGVTYYSSRMARMAESRSESAGDCYSRVYDAERPELFYKASASRVVDPGASMRLRRDARWIVPEPELALVINSAGEIIGYTIANDLTCRDIEGENPLYLPQAKIWDRCAAVGPGLLIQDSPIPGSTRIQLEISRNGGIVFKDETDLSRLKRRPQDLVAWLMRETAFPYGCYLMTGTGIIPADEFSLRPGDTVRIRIEPIGMLVNAMN